MQLTVADLKARIARRGRPERGFAREVARQGGAEDQLLFRERKKCLASAGSARGGRVVPRSAPVPPGAARTALSGAAVRRPVFPWAG
jgi:hypothetical protein